LILGGWLWFVLTLIPNIGLVQAGAQSRADRYMYIPLIGLLLMGSGMLELHRKLGRELATGSVGLSPGSHWPLATRHFVMAREFGTRFAIKFLAMAAVLMCSVGSVRQVGYWHDSTTLFTRAVAMDDRNWVAQLGLGMALTQQRRFDEARPHLEDAAELSGHSAEVEKRLALWDRLRGNRESR
jgi:hypothetical protein